MLYVIRFLQLLICSAAPSAAATYAVMQKPNENLWTALCILTFVIFLVLNIFANAALFRAVRGDFRAYFTVSIVTYALYVIFTAVVYKYTDSTVFSALCACLRSFEDIVGKTRYTVALSHIIAAAFIAVQPFIMRKRDEKLARLAAEQESMNDETVGLMIDPDDIGTAPDDPFKFDPFKDDDEEI